MHKTGSSLTTTTTKLQLIVVLALFVIASQIAQAQTESVLYSFCSQANCTDGDHPNATVIIDGAGNLYGTTAFGGANNLCVGGCGTVFKLSPSGTETILHTFGENATDGQTPVAELIMDQQGNLYGTTFAGGAYGVGTVFEVSPTGIETILHSFRKGGRDGFHPSAGLIIDALGNLYGTTCRGGAHGLGTVFELSPSGTETFLYSFAGHRAADGARPAASLIMDGKGNLYGTTSAGGAYTCDVFGCGTVFKISSSGIETILHSFAGHLKDGSFPQAGLVMDATGNLYGTTYFGGANSSGILFEVNRTGTEKVLYNFCSQNPPSQCTDGANPVGTLVRDARGNLYGATAFGGNGNGGGTVFERSPGGIERVLHSFVGSPDGDVPFPGAGLIMDAQGNLYGTTAFGGTSSVTCTIGFQGCGTVFKVTP